MNKLKKLAALLSVLFFLYGCAEVLILGAGAGLGVASYMYVDGRLAVDYPMSFDRAWNATNRALENSQISISSSMNEFGKGSIEAVRKDGKKVSIKVKDKGNSITMVAVRIGTMGDKTEAQKLHDKIAAAAGI
jgi:hypothetical protein